MLSNRRTFPTGIVVLGTAPSSASSSAREGARSGLGMPLFSHHEPGGVGVNSSEADWMSLFCADSFMAQPYASGACLGCPASRAVSSSSMTRVFAGLFCGGTGAFTGAFARAFAGAVADVFWVAGFQLGAS